MIQFKHRRAGNDFAQECVKLVGRGESLVLLGPRSSGKRYAFHLLRAVLSQHFLGPIVSCRSFIRSQPGDIASIRYDVHNGPNKCEGSGNVFDRIVELSQATQQPIIFMAPGVDALTPSLAREFLEQVRVAVTKGRITAVLSGELDFRDLVHGPGSEFNCAEQFVLQGLDRDAFEREFIKQSKFLDVKWASQADEAEKMWTHTKGNSLASALLVVAAKEACQGAGMACAQVPHDILDRALDFDSISNEILASILSRATEVISSEPEVCADLETLIRHGSVDARCPEGAPGVLEFAGIGIRDGQRIVFASEFMRRLADRYLEGRPLADLYSHAGRWEEAFERYASIGRPAPRPSSVEDRRPVQSVLQSLSAAMFASAKSGTDAVSHLLVQGARHILGFSEVSFWERRHEWTRAHEDLPALKLIADALPNSAAEPGIIPLPEAVGRFAIAAVLPSRIPARLEAVSLSSIANRNVISREQQVLANNLLQSFVEAYSQALQAELSNKRLQTRDRHIEILNRIFDLLGGPDFDVRLRLSGRLTQTVKTHLAVR